MVQEKGEEKMGPVVSDAIIVSVDFTNGKDKNIMLVGRKTLGQEDVTVINAFQGEEAEELYKRLTTQKVGVRHDKM